MAKIRNSGTIINTDYQFAKMIDGSITNVVIPSSVSVIKSGIFSSMSKLEYVYIPKNVKKINQGAFSGCTSLKDITFENNSVTSMNNAAFYGCTSLEEVNLPEGLTTIGETCFQACTLLQKVIIPTTITSFERKNNFEGCTTLKYVFFKGNTPITSNINIGLFFNCNNIRLFDMRYMLKAKDKSTGYTFLANNVYLYINVPDNLYSQFTALTNWSALTLKRWVHSCDVASFEEIENPIDGDYYSLKGDTNYLNPLGEKQIDIRQYVGGSWVEVDIDA